MSLLQIALDINEIPKDQQFISSEKYINQYLAAMTPQWQKIPRLYVDLMRKSGKIMIKNASFIELKAENSKEKHFGFLKETYESEKQFYKYDDFIIPFIEHGNGDFTAFNLHFYNEKIHDCPIVLLQHEDDENLEKDFLDYNNLPDQDDNIFNFHVYTGYSTFTQWLQAIIDGKSGLWKNSD